MNGRVLDYSFHSNSGMISGDDGNRYTFNGAQWRDAANPVRGMRVDFEARDGSAFAIYRALTTSGVAVLSGEKNKIVAGVLAILLGEFGVHKFYLGFTQPGIIMAAIGGISFLLSFLLIGVPIFLAICVIAVIEGIIYLTKTDEEFEQTYIVEKKQWF